jgi:hypothetical protein
VVKKERSHYQLIAPRSAASRTFFDLTR